MNEPAFQDKFIAFVDILGFKGMVESAEQKTGRSLSEIQELLRILADEEEATFYKSHGPRVCPESVRLHQDLSFRSTQVSDCVIASSEVSPAGVINLVSYSWGIALGLLLKGVLVRGYITRGKILHEGQQFMGTGYQTAYEREAGVSAFKREADEKGTPFIEIDPTVAEYVKNDTDGCVRKMYERMVKTDGELGAIFPFQRLQHSFMIGGFGMPPFDAEKERRNNAVVRGNISVLKEKVLQYVDRSNAAALRKINHYLSALDAQLVVCDRTDQAIDALGQPYPRSR